MREEQGLGNKVEMVATQQSAREGLDTQISRARRAKQRKRCQHRLRNRNGKKNGKGNRKR